jgi:hypothetical protein
MAHGPTTARRPITRGQEKQGAGAARTVGTKRAKTRAKGTARPAAFEIRLLLIHPTANPADVARETGLEPLRYWQRGEPRVTPKGTRLEGVWPDTRCTYGFDLENVATVEAAIASAIDRLAGARGLLARLRETGGTAELIVSLPGDAYLGASIPVESLQALAETGVGLGIEVFPKMSG